MPHIIRQVSQTITAAPQPDRLQNGSKQFPRSALLANNRNEKTRNVLYRQTSNWSLQHLPLREESLLPDVPSLESKRVKLDCPDLREILNFRVPLAQVSKQRPSKASTPLQRNRTTSINHLYLHRLDLELMVDIALVPPLC
ncbi:hypothetical protein J6590_004735 [Homalodisca vitripennis]|nr:hypothetical protein J6590_004735 [Homalodisca vitripennis]